MNPHHRRRPRDQVTACAKRGTTIGYLGNIVENWSGGIGRVSGKSTESIGGSIGFPQKGDD